MSRLETVGLSRRPLCPGKPKPQGSGKGRTIAGLLRFIKKNLASFWKTRIAEIPDRFRHPIRMFECQGDQRPCENREDPSDSQKCTPHRPGNTDSGSVWHVCWLREGLPSPPNPYLIPRTISGSMFSFCLRMTSVPTVSRRWERHPCPRPISTNWSCAEPS